MWSKCYVIGLSISQWKVFYVTNPDCWLLHNLWACLWSIFIQNFPNASSAITIKVRAKLIFHTAIKLFYFLSKLDHFWGSIIKWCFHLRVGTTDGRQLKRTKVGVVSSGMMFTPISVESINWLRSWQGVNPLVCLLPL